MRVKPFIPILILLLQSLALVVPAQERSTPPVLNFYGNPVDLPFDRSSFVDFTTLSADAIQHFYDDMLAADYQPLVQSLLAYREQYKLDDWLYYQLIRKTAQYISPKADNYYRYTLYKWFFLNQSGYNVVLRTDGSRLLFYVQSDEAIYDIPYVMRDGLQYVCLNYHDYGSIDFKKNVFADIPLQIREASRAFSYRITQMPDFNPADYAEKELQFTIYQQDYHFRIRLNPQIKTIFANYPVVDYESYFNIPLSRETYRSLIPSLKQNIQGLSVKNGVDYLMRFTRYAFLFEPDTQNFGQEKRLTPEQTLVYEYSDCEDRAALFFYLVREIYNLPMIVLSYPKHVTIAVQFDKPVGTPIVYNGRRYSICEPTPQKEDLRLGQLPAGLNKVPYEVAYVYTPAAK